MLKRRASNGHLGSFDAPCDHPCWGLIVDRSAPLMGPGALGPPEHVLVDSGSNLADGVSVGPKFVRL